MNRTLLLGLVGLAGAGVLALEIVGTRVLAPAFGSGLIVWSVQITVTLAALAIGYLLGGRMADGDASNSKLGTVLIGAGVWVVLIPLMRAPLLTMSSAWGLRWAVCCVATVLFFPALMLLGTVGPLAIRLTTRELDEVGRTAGQVFAVSTLASVIAALVTGFVLIPNVGVTRLLIAIGLSLLAGGALAQLALGGARGARTAALVLAVGALAAVGVMRGLPAPPDGLRFVGDSPYAQVKVLDHNDERMLLIDGTVQTVIDREHGFPRQPYVVVAELATEAFERGGRMLQLGLGGGSAVRAFARDGWEVDAVEIDPTVSRVAAEYFRLQPEHARVTIDDGRHYLKTTRERYGIILFDAYGAGHIPSHLISREAFGEAKSCLTPGGFVVLNLEVVGWDDPLVSAVAATLRTQFQHVIALPTSEPPNQVGNAVLMASDRVLEVSEAALGDPVGTLTDDDEHWRVLSRRHAWENQFEPAHGRVLTDDWNPADLRAAEISLAVRRFERTLLPARFVGW